MRRCPRGRSPTAGPPGPWWRRCPLGRVSIDGERVYVFSDVSLLFSRNTTGVYDLTVERDGQKVQINDLAMERRTYPGTNGKEYTGFGIYFGIEKADCSRRQSR